MAAHHPPHKNPPTKNGVSESYNLYENEAGSDVTLLVGYDDYPERIPAHTWVLARENQVFRAMFTGPMADISKKTYNIRNDPKGFQNLMKWVYRHECVMQSVDGALITLQVAIQYLCPDLAELCVNYLTTNLNAGNVLRVLQEVYRYCPAHNPELPTVPSAPSLEELETPSQQPQTQTQQQINSTKLSRSQQCLTQLHDLCEEAELRDPTLCCVDLFNACLELIDKETESVLSSELLTDIDSATLEVIIRRDSLTIPNEVTIVTALQRWSTARCKRDNLPLIQSSRRAVLGHLIGHVRFLVMSGEQLQQCASLLTSDEFNFLITPKKNVGGVQAQPPPTLAPYAAHMATHRRPPTPTAHQNSKTPPKKKTKKKYTKKELVLDIVSCLSVIFD